MATSPSKQRLRDERRKSGRCIHCGEPALPAPHGGKHATLTYCAKHQQSHVASYAKSAAASIAAGICPNIGCSNTPEPGRTYCKSCSQTSASRTARRRGLRVAAGMCGHCGKRPRLPDHLRCQECLDDENQSIRGLHAERIEAGICTRCGENPIGDGRNSLCDDCVVTTREYRASIKLAVLNAYGGPVCVGCGDTEAAILQIDHIAGGGNRHALAIGGGDSIKGRSRMYHWLRDNDFPPGYRVLCPSCNIRAARGLPFPNQRCHDDVDPATTG